MEPIEWNGIMGRKYETRIVKLTDQELRRQLTELEMTYNMTSADFLQRYNRGELGDDQMFIRWSGLLRTASKAGLPKPIHA